MSRYVVHSTESRMETREVTYHVDAESSEEAVRVAQARGGPGWRGSVVGAWVSGPRRVESMRAEQRGGES